MNYSKEQLTSHKNTPPSHGAGEISKKVRSSNLELYRIVCMLMIVAHHYVVNSGLFVENGVMANNPMTTNSIWLACFGAWGKVGINCFLMITGYYMCTSQIALRKFVKLLAQIYFYRLLLFPILFLAGYETLSISRIIKLLMPVWRFTDNFTSCFIAFYLTIPFLIIFIKSLNKRQHELLILLCLLFYTVLGSIPTFYVTFNYITWFGIIFIISSYIRLYPQPLFDNGKLWALLTFVCILLAFVSIVVLQWKMSINYEYFFMRDSNKFIPVMYAVCSFLWFKNMDIKYSKIINAFGAGTFGVLLIHANSDAMRTLLWKDTVDCVGHYSLPFGYLALYSVGVVLAIFVICNLIDQLRINTLEKWFFNWYDNKCAAKAEVFVSRLLTGK